MSSFRPKIKSGAFEAEWIFRAKALKLFNQGQQNAIMRFSIKAAAEKWITKWLPKRFSDYAKVLGYHVKQSYLKAKRRITKGPVRPLVLSGEMESASRGARADAVATKNRVRATIRIPTEHGLKSKEHKVIRNVVAREMADIQNTFRETAYALMNGATTNRAGRRVLTATQRVRLGIKPRAKYSPRHQRSFRGAA